jgi:excisionase family DNA binding protein
MAHTQLPKLLRVPAVADALDVTVPRARELVRTGAIKCVRIGRQVRIDADEVQKYINAGGRALPGGWRRQAGTDQVA